MCDESTERTNACPNEQALKNTVISSKTAVIATLFLSIVIPFNCRRTAQAMWL